MGTTFSAFDEGNRMFIHLRARTAYSLLEGAMNVKALTKHVVKLRMPAVAVTDTNNLFGALELSESLEKEGVQPIIGVTLKVRFPADAVRPEMLGALALIAQNEAGYQNLMALSTAAFFAAEAEGEPLVDFSAVGRALWRHIEIRRRRPKGAGEERPRLNLRRISEPHLY